MALRAATLDERRAMSRLSRADPLARGLAAAWLGTMAFLVMLGVSYLVTGARTVTQSLLVTALGAAGLWFQLYFRRVSRRARAYDPTSRGEVDLSQVDEVTFDVVGAVEVAELEDEGRHFYLSLRDGRTVFLSGQYLYDEVKSQRFPAERVTVVRAPSTRTVIGLRTSGAYLAPREKRPAFTLDDVEAGRVPEDGTVT